MPLLRGLIRDGWLKGHSELLGYASLIAGEVLLTLSSTPNLILLALIFVALGSGFIKVGLASMLGGLPAEQKHKGYDLYYNTSCIGFISGALVAPCIFGRFLMSGVAACAVASAILSLACHLIFLHNVKSGHPKSTEPVDEVGHRQDRPWFFVGFLLAGLPFFACFNQLLTSIPIYVHQCLNRTVGDFSVPALWFGAFGSLMVTGISPVLRKCWGKTSYPFDQIYILKFALGCMIAAMAFGSLMALVMYGDTFSVAYGIGAVMFVHILCYIADFHIRPTLLGLATYCTRTQHHTFATGLVFACIGLGGKLAGILASYTDQIGFDGVFGICFAGCFMISVVFLIAYRYARQKSLGSVRV
jgi:dipeptide/tripeptide permease